MSVAPETLDTALCEWCITNTKAYGVVDFPDVVDGITGYIRAWVYLCNTHFQETVSEFRNLTHMPLANKPEYTLLETYANPMTNEYTIKELETVARYGAPYPVCGDLTTLKQIGKSWVGHNPEGEQY